MSEIRYINREDLPHLREVIDSTGLFPAELLDGMIEDFFHNRDRGEIWLTQDIDGVPAVIVYCAQEKLTVGTYNLYLIAVHSKHQGKGIGTEVLHFLELLLQRKSNRVLLVETSSLPEFDRTRKFYDQYGFQRAAIIPDFYKEGEGKVIFYKKLNAS